MSWKKGQAVRLLPLSEATGRVLDIYRDVQCVFGVPHISSFFQFLGTHPRFLESFWTTVRPIVQSQAFFACAHRLRADSYTRVHTYFEVPDLKSEVTRLDFSLGAREELKSCINFFCYAVPISLMLSALLSESFEGPAGSSEVPLTPAPRPKPHGRIVLVDEDSAGPVVKSIFADIRTATNADVVHTVYRAFARWPDFLQSYWTAVKPITVSELFQHSENALREDALQIVKELPGPIEFSSSDLDKMGINEADSSSLIKISDMFVHSLSAAMLNVSVARIAMEGGSMNTKSTPEDSAPKAEVPST
ncbi:MAG TPA: halocarboxylic acid dehydrogenase DehI family protein [Candidatus Saccharimonadales bacterium]|nr:halocarboxylic acid dehydrogenase DehI family protein [Candidatus Saccharimonadales bacterium]